MLREPVDLLVQAAGLEPLDGLDEAGVKRAPPVPQQCPVGHLVRQRGRVAVGGRHAPAIVRACTASSCYRAATTPPRTTTIHGRRGEVLFVAISRG